MDRDIYNDLLNWKESPKRKPLILDGARQTGKTYILKEFGRNEYEKFVYVNLDKDKTARDIVEYDKNVGRIMEALSAHARQDITPGDTLVVLDEVQESPETLGLLKYFKEDAPEIHIAVAGSLLGITLHGGHSFPVGQVDMLKLHPMSFGEYLDAKGDGRLRASLDSMKWNVVSSLDSSLKLHFREYCFVGGMPEAVAAFVAGEGPNAVRKIQGNILAGYRRDFSKHAPKNDMPRIEAIWDSVPRQLVNENKNTKKFQYSQLKKGGRSDEYGSPLRWLLDAGLITKVERVNKLLLPVKYYSDGAFKVFPLDVGLLGAEIDAPVSQILSEDTVFKEYKGALAECFAVQESVAYGMEPYYYGKEDGRKEIDMVIQDGKSVVPIEIKSGKNVASPSLSREHESNPGLRFVRFSMLPYKEQDWLTNYPLYAAGSFFLSVSNAVRKSNEYDGSVSGMRT